MIPAILVATWSDGLFAMNGGTVRHEVPGRSVCGLAGDGRGGTLAIVDGHSLRRRSSEGAWSEIATSEAALTCCVPVGDDVFVGTDDARVLRVASDGTLQPLASFDAVSGRERWYAGSALVDGKLLGPPLGIRSIAATCNGAVLLANVHVGGIPRSADGGSTWQPTIDIDVDIHEVCTHPTRPDIAIAAAAAGLCVSRDAGATWTIESEGLHTPYCSGVALGETFLYVSASTDPFSARGAVYRRRIDGDGPLLPLGGGMPAWIDGVADTNCIATVDSTAALIDASGRVYVSYDDGETWSSPYEQLPVPSGIHIC